MYRSVLTVYVCVRVLQRVHILKVSIHVLYHEQRLASLNGLFPDVSACFKSFRLFLVVVLMADVPASSIEYIHTHTKKIYERHLCNIKTRLCGRVLWPGLQCFWLASATPTVTLQQLRSIVVTDVGGDGMIFYCRRRRTDPFISLHFNIYQDVERVTPLPPSSVRVSNQLFSMNVFYFALGFFQRLPGVKGLRPSSH